MMKGASPKGRRSAPPNAGAGVRRRRWEWSEALFPSATIVARLLRGEPLELVAREMNVSIAKLSEWRERALAGAAGALKERERDDRDDKIARLKSKVGEITTLSRLARRRKQ